MSSVEFLKALVVLMARNLGSIAEITRANLAMITLFTDNKLEDNSLATAQVIYKSLFSEGVIPTWRLMIDINSLIEEATQERLFDVEIFGVPKRKIQVARYIRKEDTRYWTRKTSLRLIEGASFICYATVLASVDEETMMGLVKEFEYEGFYQYNIERV